jgi:glutamate/aspartate transport system permease protein
MRRALLQDIELMPQCQISASNRRRDLKQSHSMRTKRRPIAIIRRSCSDSLLTASRLSFRKGQGSVNYNWNWGIFFQTSPDGVHTYLETLLLGTGWTLATALSAWCLALAMGSLVGVIRTTPNPWLVRLGTAYVELFRNIPLLVQMFLWYFVLPELLPTQLGDWLKQLPDASFYTAVVALGFYTSARVAEQVRAGILSLARGQGLAALALGLTQPQAYIYVLLPMAYRIILPPLTSEFLNVIKNSAVALTIGLMELTARARAMQEFSFQVFEAFTAATIIYIVINIIVTFAMRYVEQRVAVPGLIGAKPAVSTH